MAAAAGLPFPVLSRGRFSHESAPEGARPIHAFTDDGLFASCGVRIAFTDRGAGYSVAPYDSLNLATHVGDDPLAVSKNRRKLLTALDAPQAQLIVPNQVHGTNVVRVGAHATLEDMEAARDAAVAGADAVVTARSNIAALLCFADCLPLILVAPRGAFAVVHAGWRGAYARIASAACEALCEEASCVASECNAYIGPYLHAECFEVSADLAYKFKIAFGEGCVPDDRHVDLGAAVRADLLSAGFDEARIADADVCTSCRNDEYFSYRRQAGICGRHGALAVRLV